MNPELENQTLPFPAVPYASRPAPSLVSQDTVRFGVIGYGYWGPNVVRNLHGLEGACLSTICDQSPNALKRAKQLYPSVAMTKDSADILASPDIDAVAIVTPVWTHYDLAKRALENGKHVFLEKPLTSNVRQAEDLIELADRKNLCLMVDHTFLFTGAVRKISQLIDDGTLGDLYYYDSTRVNLGLFQHDINVVWDLAPHDLSIMDHLIREKPEALVATGECHLNGHVDVAFITVYFPRNIIAHINVNWLSPVKVRTTLIGGEKKMLVWNDLEA
ncbi:MAG TPA: Gfo/Idh/MocA family oxidoreductase, partial [Candidatus Binatia bacterium]|nr:Gfo/Idh/MocA family oxidoreductase [Candidatus Binatia bacterium]